MDKKLAIFQKRTIKKQCEKTTYRYSLYYPKYNTDDVRDARWDVQRYSNDYNPFVYFKGYDPIDNRINKIIYSQIQNAQNTPSENIANEYGNLIDHPNWGILGAYVKPNLFNNRGHYIVYKGIPYDDVKVHELTHASHPDQQVYYIEEEIFNGKTPNVVPIHSEKSIRNASEIYGALQQYRYKYNLKPDQIIDKKYLDTHRDTFKGTYLENLKDEELLRLFNEVAQNTSIPFQNNDETYLASKGGHINYLNLF